MSAAVLRADALRLPLADASVDLIVTSPPYFALRSYRDEGEHFDGQLGSEATPQAFLEALWAVTAECWRVLKPTGSMWVNLGDKYAGSGGHNNSAIGADPERGPSAYNKEAGGIRSKSLLGLPWRYAIGCIDGGAAPGGQRWILRAEIVWSKPNGLPESVTDRVRRSHEQWFHMVKSPRYFAAVDEVREAQLSSDRPQGRSNGSRWVENVDQGRVGSDEWRLALNPLGKLPGSVWSIPSEPLIIPEAVARHYDLPDHFAAFPQEWPRRIILGWSPSGICVECGEGRRPVVDHQRTFDGKPADEYWQGKRSSFWQEGRTTNRGVGNWRFGSERSVIGYACACALDVPGTFYGGDGPEEVRLEVPPTRPAVVLDPFGGTGTTAMVARTLGRFGVSVDLSADYCRLARWRIFESGHGEKAAQRTHRENQGDLFSNAPSVHCEDCNVPMEAL